ncbi:adenosyl-chloride synthase [bacterium BMS3Bbin12]|nr:adenosyl-chloride synthase [bacterium BMS3Abin12]GBE48465.1 adenosyl-chloride synthase [bacterium BMS3Bbin12]GBE50216.1 adenosyl-chloride synthase [bacterium BMS3Bbin13]
MIVLFTDFGLEGPYTGQMQAVLHREAPGVPVVGLFSDLPPFDPRGAAYLLAAYAGEFPLDTVFLCVVDPGVGGPRAASVLRADGRWYVGPDNGLLAIAARRAGHRRWWNVSWRPARLSASFHGRDLFAPVAARLARGEPPPGEVAVAEERLRADWPDDLPRVVYVDRFGNVMTGLRATGMAPGAIVEIRGHRLRHARTFSDVPRGEGFWYENANGLVELAVNAGRADQAMGIAVGDAVRVAVPGRA